MTLRISTLTLIIAAAACDGPPASTPPPTTPGADPFRANALALVKQLGGELKGALMQGIKAGGPPHAINYCNQKAPELTQRLSNDQLTIRRIGTRVRNSKTNTPTATERKHLGALTVQEPVYVGTIDGKKTLLKGIFINNPVCLNCHGDNLPEPVRTNLAKHYPDDRATGYKLGDLRGAFVVQPTQQ